MNNTKYYEHGMHGIEELGARTDEAVTVSTYSRNDAKTSIL